jgi:hypothetical protein
VSLWEFYYEVDRDCLPPFVWDLEGLEFTKGPMSLCFGPKAEIASATILTYVLRHLWPPVGSGDKFECFHLPGCRDVGVMVLSNDLVTEFGILGYVDPVSEKN